MWSGKISRLGIYLNLRGHQTDNQIEVQQRNRKMALKTMMIYFLLMMMRILSLRRNIRIGE